MAEWLRRGLQILLSQFDSGRGLQIKIGGMNKEILKIALNTENLSFLENHTHSTKLKNSTCGDEIKIYLIVKNKKIHLNKEWKNFFKIMNKSNILRKECLLLPIKATLKALKN